MEHREFLEMLASVEGLTHGQSAKLARTIDRRGDLDEVHRLIENRFERDKKCPHCGKTHLQRWGNAAGLRRFKCMSCNKTFNALAVGADTGEGWVPVVGLPARLVRSFGKL